MAKQKFKTPEEEFEAYREALLREGQRMVSFIFLYKLINGRKTDRLNELNIAPAFFSTVLDALYSAIIIWAVKLLKPEEKSEVTLFKFLAFVEKHIDLFTIQALQKRRKFSDAEMVNRESVIPAMIEDDRNAIRGLTAFPSLRLRRNKFHAHFDEKYFTQPGSISKDAPLAWDDLDKIVEVIAKVFNRYSRAYDANSYKLDMINIHDLDSILDILFKHNKSLADEVKLKDN